MVQLVGILNITPDSFSDGGNYFDVDAAVKRAEQLFKEGAAIVDVGAESTRPKAAALSDEQEWARLEPVLKVLIPLYPNRISLDTYHPATVRKAFEIGPLIVNDVTSLNDPEMVKVVVGLHARVIISHLPAMSIQDAHMLQPVGNEQQVKNELLSKADSLLQKGLERQNIILDPGIGFGKTPQLNWRLLKFAELVPDYSVMIGYSRKRFLGDKRMEIEPNLEAGRIAIAHGAAYLRVHDVKLHASLL